MSAPAIARSESISVAIIDKMSTASHDGVRRFGFKTARRNAAAKTIATGLKAAEIEVDRYISWPGQALAYMIGRLEIQRIRAEAESVLGSGFDIKAFHDTVLGSGPMPLGVLDRHVKDWVAKAA